MIQQFLNEVATIQKTGVAGEHAYRPALQKLFNELSEDVRAVNEPARVDVGAPDFVFLRGDIPIGHCEAKDLGTDVKVLKGYSKEQKKRYTEGFQNLIYTNCLDWRFYREGELISEVTIADFLMGIQPRLERFAALEQMLRDFIAQTPQTITSSKRLAVRMAGKAILIKDVLARSLLQDKDKDTELTGQYQAFKEHLIHDISLEDFADIYAETIAYGMFAARLHDDTLEDFSRQEALDLLPRSNPFLRSLFSYIAGPSLDYRISWIIDDLAKVFQATDVRKILERFGHTTRRNDPFLHFYEDFLAAYNPRKRDVRGVWYTPEPVVDFIVRAVDDVLKADFGITEGLADNSKITIDWETGQTDKKGKPLLTKKDVHKVQILDPAAGTGTFLAQVIKHIAPRIQEQAPGMWAGYVEKDLIPRLHGFELLMASYAMCHMKLEMILREYGYTPTANPPRVSVYLTNSLEEGEAANQTLPFAQWLSNEVKAANTVKRDLPIMCVIGNPPYNSSSANMGEYARNIVRPYKQGLNEQRIHLDDDYIKFVRLAEIFVEKAGKGLFSYICNNSFLSGVTHRRMREHLLKTFDRIDIINLHGDIRSGLSAEQAADDENVFDITQGVSIIICSRHIGEDALAKVRYYELVASRDEKNKFLHASSVSTIGWQELSTPGPSYYFVPKTNDGSSEYEKGFRISDFMPLHSSGVQTKRDALCVAFDGDTMRRRLDDFRANDVEGLRAKYSLPPDGRDWSIQRAIADVSNNRGEVTPILYRPFDVRYSYYSGLSRGFIAYPRRNIMQHVVQRENTMLIANRQCVGDNFSFVGVSKIMNCHGTFYLGNKGQDYAFPLYLYPEEDELDQARRVNFDDKLYSKLRKLAEHVERGEPDEVAVLDYIYGVLHCPAYRETYAEFLKIDFPRIAWPTSPDVFWDVSDKGGELRRLHLMEADAIGDAPYPFMGEGDNTVEKLDYREGKVWINETQYFDVAPPVSWDFYIGGYQPAQKWLKDRKGRTLNFDDVKQYQRILKILSETDRIMKTIDMPLTEAADEPV